MKKSILVSIVVLALAFGGFMLGKLLSQMHSSPATTPESVKKAQELRAAQQAAATKQQPSTKVSSLMFDSQQQSLTSGTKFTLKALVDPKGKKISASEIHITFDPKMIKLESIDPSDEFSLVLSNSKIDNENGTASIVLGVPLGKPSMDAVSAIASFNFQALSVRGQTEISFTDKSGAAADGETSNIIAVLVPTAINVQ